MIESPVTFIKTSLFNLIAFAFVSLYVTICVTNQEYIRSKAMPDPWIRNNIVLSTLVMLHLIFMVALPKLTSLTMAFIAVFVSMQVVVARFFRTDGFQS